MKKVLITAAACAAAIAAQAHPVPPMMPKGVPHLDHVYMIMMENHGYNQIINNPNAPFINSLAKTANLATNYYAVGHPSLTNYLEVVGGSNFGVRDDNSPDWHNAACTPNIATGTASLESTSDAICPIGGTGMDAATPAVDMSNEASGPPGSIDVDGTVGFDAASTTGMTIADQLVYSGRSWKSYQEDLPPQGPDNVNTSDGVYSNLTDFSAIQPQLNPPLSVANIVSLYAVKHNPFVYFKNVQEGYDPRNSLKNVADFTGADGLYADLATGRVPNFAFIAPNQCNDQHGRGNGGPFCNYDPASDGTQAGLNPALIYRGDVAVKKLVTAIKHSPAWRNGGRSAIVILWDENDYSTAPNTNQVVLIVDTNYGVHGVHSSKFYTHFSLLKTLESGFGLPCLNHACDSSAALMTDLFADDGYYRFADDDDRRH